MEINNQLIAQDIQIALAEDIGSGDVTANLLPDDLYMHGIILSREPLVVCGQPWANAVFASIDSEIRVTWLADEGDYLDAPSTLCKIHGSARSLLTAERTVLNFIQTLSGTASTTRSYVQKLVGTNVRLLDTRKTIPGLRLAQKYAVRCGGGFNHRLGLHDAFLIKENHIKACGSITGAIKSARALNSSLLIEVEVVDLIELNEALDASPDRILLDNFTVDMMLEAVSCGRKRRCQLEVSGGINLDNICQVAATGIDFISVGALTKSVRAIDLSLLLE